MSATPTETATTITDLKVIIHATECPCAECEPRRRSMAAAIATEPLCGAIQKRVENIETTIVISAPAYDYLLSRKREIGGAWEAPNGFRFCAGATFGNEYRNRELLFLPQMWRGNKVVLEDLPMTARKELIEDFPRLKEALAQLAAEMRKQPAKTETSIFDGVEIL